MKEYVTVPVELLKQLHEGLIKVEEVLATLEELADKEGLKSIRSAEEEYKRGEFTVVKDANEIRKML